MVEYCLIVPDEKYTEDIDTHSPDDRTDHIICPEVPLEHATCSRDKWDKCSCKIMEFAERDIPESVFFELLMEYFLFSLAHSEPFSVFFYELRTYLFPYPVADIIPEHRTDDCSEYREKEVLSCPESSDEYHDIHPWHCRPDDGKWLDTCRCKCDKIIPIPEWLYEVSYPENSTLYPVLTDERYDDEGQCPDRQYDGYRLREEGKEMFDIMHGTHDIEKKKKSKRKGFNIINLSIKNF